MLTLNIFKNNLNMFKVNIWVYQMMLNKIFVTFKSLPSPVRTSSIVYIYCLLGYNIFGTYVDSKIYLQKYREGNLHELGVQSRQIDTIRNDWDAVKYGAKANAINRLWDSLVWPITSITNVVPAIVLLLNPRPKTD